MKAMGTARSLVAILAAAGVAAAGFLAPSNAATKSSVVYVTSNPMTSLNSGKPSTNLATNGYVGYLTGMGFWYYDNKPALVRNTTFGSFKIVKNTPKDFRVEYKINPGRVWSDGTPITATDLLLSHVLSSSAYSKAAGLGDPANSESAPSFDSSGYGSAYDQYVVGNPIVGKDGLTLTVRYSQPIADWELSGPGPSPVHALVHLAEGKKGLQPLAANNAAKAKFASWFNSKSTANLKKMADVWNTAYDIKTIDNNTNPLLLISNGGFIVRSAVADQSVSFARNARYNSGPRFTGNIRTVVFRFLSDESAAAQALANREIDLYEGAPTADTVAQLKNARGVKVLSSLAGLFEHVDIRVGAAPGTDDEYTGPFAYSNNRAKNLKAKDLRTAFLLTVPRDQMVNTLIKPISSEAQRLDSLFVLPGEPGYSDLVKKNGISAYAGTQAAREAKALELVKKHYPNASATNPVVKVKMLWGQPSNVRRAAQAQLIKAAAAKAGFDVEATGTSGWSGFLEDNSFDVQFYAWQKTSLSQSTTAGIYQSDGYGMSTGLNNAELDRILDRLNLPLTRAQYLKVVQDSEKILYGEAITIPLFQWPGVVAHNATLKNVSAGPLSPGALWNYWAWAF